ncbi:sorbosone dehydrogenase family protein [Neptuniibacter sp. 2_MG-2023]|jgi:glucose/arabinose dehydrogenase|uniref:PQQ-dependent sugar dehydrogenase n=1 Tax=Neptuniibacter sp. 2_MG-2023 TaxID=3062671 RepID=UPI0026E3436A|nr:PQQ-dependent sugar dehydrogenase [Neptuniibacter sp. 2_MG-2023]MDO6514088.1 PQQ-dependent sugar dehydrogenase [Neptuniibacter sp. 2_MG-2023]
MITPLSILISFSGISELPLETLTLPPSYKIEVVAKAPNVRQLALAKDGTLFAGSRRAGNLYGFIDQDKDGIYEQTLILATELNMPSGIAVKGNDLYVAEVSRILRYKEVLPLKPSSTPTPEIYYDKLPDKTHHGWKYLKFGPDEALYFNIGAPCNICLPEQPFATIMKLDNHKNTTLIAQGVRNSVGFAWNPLNQQLWFTENGRDHLGDDQPSDELNHVTDNGEHFGYPFFHAQGLADPKYGKKQYTDQQPLSYTPAAYKLGAHVAPLGMTFSVNASTEAQQTLYIAEHGSWNRSQKVGYRVVELQIKNNKVISHKPFISGWLKNEKYWGRPNDIIETPEGSLLISDDHAGVIYRLSKIENNTP